MTPWRHILEKPSSPKKKKKKSSESLCKTVKPGGATREGKKKEKGTPGGTPFYRPTPIGSMFPNSGALAHTLSYSKDTPSRSLALTHTHTPPIDLRGTFIPLEPPSHFGPCGSHEHCGRALVGWDVAGWFATGRGSLGGARLCLV